MNDPRPGWSLKGFLFAGLAAVLPTLLVIVVVAKGLDLVHSYGGGQVTGFLFPRDPGGLSARMVGNLLALALFVALALGIGLVVRSVFGRQILDLLEQGILRIPLVNRIYPALRQLTDFLMSGRRPEEFQRVVAIPYPNPGLYSIGFVTGEGLPEVEAAGARRFLTVFVPSSPLPFTGWICLVPAEQAIPLQISVEEALSFCVSAGVSRPGRP